MDMKKRQPLGIELVRRGIVDGDAIERALQYQMEHPNKRVGDILYILKEADPERLAKEIGDIIGEKGIFLTEDIINIDVTEYIPWDMMKKNKAVPFDIESGKIKVAFADVAGNKDNIKSIKMMLLNKGLVMEPYMAFETNIEEYFAKFESKIEENMGDLEDTNSVTDLIDNIIKLAIEKRASDIHIEPQLDSVRVRFRIDGQLFVMANIGKEKQPQMIGRLKAISNMHQEKQESQDGRILLYDDYNIRVSSQKNIYGEKFVLRMLKKTAKIRDIFELGFPFGEKELNKAVNKKNSLTIMAAPTGEGKTTTLYSILDYLKSDDINITTIEDPVEIRIPGLNQIEIDKNVRFADSLRTILRQDPDVILVGEIRDKETAEIATQAGQTGHYVLSTIHTIDAVEVVTRLRKMGLTDYDIASTVGTTISQRLLRRLCPHCRRERELSDYEKEIIEKIGAKYNYKFKITGKKTYDAVGCDKCNNSGYYDRIGIFEVLNIDDDIKELIMEGKSSIEIRRKAMEKDYRPLVVDGVTKVLQGDTNLNELNKKLIIFNNL
ncbi:MAG: type II/IV secretion system protein [Clostridia bacterium]|nr:type II/IV secretion system protein [Clostridia bacterium]